MVTGSLFEETDAFRNQLTESLARLARERVYIGTSSWKYEGWLDQIYTRSSYARRGRFSKKAFEAECLREYAAVFPTVCGDFAFYQFPSDSFWQKLFAQTPLGFQFAFKVPEQITCESPSYLDLNLLKNAFLRPLEAFRDKICVLIFEFRASSLGLPEFLERLDPFLEALPRQFRYAIEVRNEEYLERNYFQCLSSHGIAHVLNAWARMPELSEQIAIPEAMTADFVVCRALLRRGRKYEEAVRLFSPYQQIQDPNPEARGALREIMVQARATRKDAYIYVNNRFEGNAPATILAVADST